MGVVGRRNACQAQITGARVLNREGVCIASRRNVHAAEIGVIEGGWRRIAVNNGRAIALDVDLRRSCRAGNRIVERILVAVIIHEAQPERERPGSRWSVLHRKCRGPTTARNRGRSGCTDGIHRHVTCRRGGRRLNRQIPSPGIRHRIGYRHWRTRCLRALRIGATIRNRAANRGRNADLRHTGRSARNCVVERIFVSVIVHEAQPERERACDGRRILHGEGCGAATRSHRGRSRCADGVYRHVAGRRGRCGRNCQIVGTGIGDCIGHGDGRSCSLGVLRIGATIQDRTANRG